MVCLLLLLKRQAAGCVRLSETGAGAESSHNKSTLDLSHVTPDISSRHESDSTFHPVPTCGEQPPRQEEASAIAATAAAQRSMTLVGTKKITASGVPKTSGLPHLPACGTSVRGETMTNEMHALLVHNTLLHKTRKQHPPLAA